MISLPAVDQSLGLWAPIIWEPVANTGERLTVGALVRFDGKFSAHRLIRDEVLDCLFGKKAVAVAKLIEFALHDFVQCAELAPGELQSLLGGFHLGRFHSTAPQSISDALRAAALMYCSLASLERLDEPDETDTPQADDTNKRFTTEVREHVVSRRPDLHQFFGRSTELIRGGQRVRFGFCSTKTVIHFGVLHPVRQSGSVLAARARLWELKSARDIAQLQNACLVFAVPRPDDPLLTSSQLDAVKRNVEELEGEADTFEMRFVSVLSAEAAAQRVIEFA